ncbi:S-layer homology domain-containing protein [Caryophanon latum]|uniref:SLH domain-containing protein n=1 Tax=Caryophanon latum TaxID=33977 RepID=A0A1C0YBJ9_9BACL|nr:S-layer homology domain-containing protein [Caryophanon latum]OCS84567.1 hypothetical protein A6K76_15505 [Caryophanon latum]
MFKKVTTFATAAALALSFASATSAAKFKDVPVTHSLNIEIEYLAEKGIIGGYTDNTFKPNAPISKKHIAKMLVEALDLPTTNLKPLPYKDVPKTHPYYKEIAAAYTAGIFGDASNFKPESSISRAFMAKMIANSFDLKSIEANAVTYEDVPNSNEFYQPVQLVTMNNIARGYENTTTKTYTFEPTKLLTRAHFSAFLARAISLKTESYIPDKKYTYIFERANDKSRFIAIPDDHDNGGGSEWTLQEVKTDEYYSSLWYQIRDGFWTGSVLEYGEDSYVDHPFTIGLKFDNTEKSTHDKMRQEILATDATYKIGNVEYKDVVVIRERSVEFVESNGFYKPGGFVTRTLYVADGYGIIAHKKEDKLYESLIERKLQ